MSTERKIARERLRLGVQTMVMRSEKLARAFEEDDEWAQRFELSKLAVELRSMAEDAEAYARLLEREGVST